VCVDIMFWPSFPRVCVCCPSLLTGNYPFLSCLQNIPVFRRSKERSRNTTAAAFTPLRQLNTRTTHTHIHIVPFFPFFLVLIVGVNPYFFPSFFPSFSLLFSLIFVQPICCARMCVADAWGGYNPQVDDVPSIPTWKLVPRPCGAFSSSDKGTTDGWVY